MRIYSSAYIYIHVAWNHVDTDKLTTANGGTFTSSSARKHVSHCVERIRGVLVHDDALYKSTFYLLTYLLTPVYASTFYFCMRRPSTFSSFLLKRKVPSYYKVWELSPIVEFV